MVSRSVLTLAFVLSFGVVPVNAALAAESDGVVDVFVDQAKISKIVKGTASMVIGNPAIADVTMLKGGNSMVVTGKGYGETNLIMVDEKGDVIEERTIRVQPSAAVLVVQRGSARMSYSCRPHCMPSVQLGDDNEFFGNSTGQIGARNALASGSK
jgi:hypothetical protein